MDMSNWDWESEKEAPSIEQIYKKVDRSRRWQRGMLALALSSGIGIALAGHGESNQLTALPKLALGAAVVSAAIDRQITKDQCGQIVRSFYREHFIEKERPVTIRGQGNIVTQVSSTLFAGLSAEATTRAFQTVHQTAAFIGTSAAGDSLLFAAMYLYVHDSELHLREVEADSVIRIQASRY